MQFHAAKTWHVSGKSTPCCMIHTCNATLCTCSRCVLVCCSLEQVTVRTMATVADCFYNLTILSKSTGVLYDSTTPGRGNDAWLFASLQAALLQSLKEPGVKSRVREYLARQLGLPWPELPNFMDLVSRSVTHGTCRAQACCTVVVEGSVHCEL